MSRGDDDGGYTKMLKGAEQGWEGLKGAEKGSDEEEVWRGVDKKSLNGVWAAGWALGLGNEETMGYKRIHRDFTGSQQCHSVVSTYTYVHCTVEIYTHKHIYMYTDLV